MEYIDILKDQIAKVEGDIKEIAQDIKETVQDLKMGKNLAEIEHLRQREKDLRNDLRDLRQKQSTLSDRLHDEMSKAHHSLQQSIQSSSAS